MLHISEIKLVIEAIIHNFLFLNQPNNMIPCVNHLLVGCVSSLGMSSPMCHEREHPPRHAELNGTVVITMRT